MVAPPRTEIAEIQRMPGGGLDVVHRVAPDDVWRLWLPGEAFPRVVIDPQVGQVLTGGGAAPPTALGGGGGTVLVTSGGTGVNTLAAHGVLIGNGAGNVVVSGAGSAGQVLTSNGAAADPTFQAAAGGAPSGPAGGDLAGTYPNPTLGTAGPGATGPLGSATRTNAVTIDAKGRVTAFTDQAIALSATGDVTGTLPGATTIAGGAVSLAKMANLAANSIIGNNTGAPATPIALTAAQTKTLLAITEADVANLTTDLAAKQSTTLTSAHLLVGSAGNVATDTAITGDVTISNAGVTAIGAGKVTNTMLAGSIDLTTKVTGALPPANGGTGLATLTAHGLVVGEGTGNVAFVGPDATSTKLLQSAGAAADPAFVSLSGDVTIAAGGAVTIAAGAVTLAKMANLAANSIIGNNTGAGATPLALSTAQVMALLSAGATADFSFNLQHIINTLFALAASPANQTATGVTTSLTYGAATTIGAPVYYTATSDVRPANASGIATAPVMGIALSTSSSGAHDVLVGPGIYRDDTNYNFATIGGPVYLGTTAGTLTQTQPSGTDQVIQPVGIALATRILLFIPNLNYITHT